MCAAAVKQTLYQILGVEPKASTEDIAAAYRARLAALDAKASYDPSARGLLQQAHEILSDPNQRSAYDASIVARTVRAAASSDWAPEPTFVGTWGKWIVAAVVLTALAIWWITRSKPPTAQKPAPPQAITRTIIVSPAPAQPKDPPTIPAEAPATSTPPSPIVAPPVAAARTAENVFMEVSPSVVRVSVFDGSGRMLATGSGVVIDKGAVITNCHVAKRGVKLAVKLAEKTVPATIQLADEALDLCRLSVPEITAPMVAIGSVASLSTGQRVYAVGSPLGLDLTISEGIVSALRQVQDGTVIQTTAPISPGSSGGGLFDVSGRLVGIMTFQHRYGQNLNFAVPADWIGQMRQRSTAELAQRSVSGAARSPDQSAPTLILGQWFCRDLIGGRSGHYAFEPDGSVNIAMADRKIAALKYRVSGKVLQIADSQHFGALMIEDLTSSKMVLHTGVEGYRLVCERQ